MFGIEPQDYAGEFRVGSGIEEVGAIARRRYPSTRGDAKNVEHVL
jgi:hypothetical protein